MTGEKSDTQIVLDGIVGMTFCEVALSDHKRVLTFSCADSQGQYRMQHLADCCSDGWLEDVVGDLSDLVGAPILYAEESHFESPDKEASWRLSDGEGSLSEYQPGRPPETDETAPQESYTWTFYRLGTKKGSVTLRWFGTSNGYYSESIDFRLVSE